MEKTNYPTNLIDAVFGGSKTIVAVDVNRISEWLENLSYREKAVVKMRYEDGMTLEEIGKEFGVTRERIRQIDAKALRKLRHPSYAKIVACISLVEHNEKMEQKQEEIDSLSRRYRELRAYTKKLHEAIAEEIPSLTKVLSALPEAPGTEDLADMKIEALGLSSRAENVLLRAGFETAKEIEAKKIMQMRNLRNINGSCIDEIRDKLIDFGFDPKF